MPCPAADNLFSPYSAAYRFRDASTPFPRSVLIGAEHEERGSQIFLLVNLEGGVNRRNAGPIFS